MLMQVTLPVELWPATLCVIRCFDVEEKGRIYRTIRGAGSVSLSFDAIEIDYDAVLELKLENAGLAADSGQAMGDQTFRDCHLKAKTIGWCKKVFAHWRHPDPAFRVPLQVAISLGLISLAISIISLSLGAIG